MILKLNQAANTYVKNSLVFFITGGYFILTYFGILHHEIWLDEAQHILLARDSHSISEMIWNARYEGHPFLWNLLVYVVIHGTGQIMHVQLMHILISSFCVFLLLKYSPFSLLVNLLMCFGYFLLFEYSVISRNYSLSLLFLLLVLINISPDKKNYIRLFVLLALLMNTHTFSGILSISFFIVLWKELSTQKRSVRFTCLFIFLTALLLFLLQVIPPHDHFLHAYNINDLLSSKRIGKALHLLIMGVFPIPDLSLPNYWGNNAILRFSKIIITALAAALFFMPALLFYTNKKSLVLFYSGTLGILAFTYLTPLMPATRHGGFITMLLLASAWLKKTSAPDEAHITENKTMSEQKWVKNTTLIFFGSILIVQFSSGLIFFCLELRGKFSNAQSTAQFLNTHFSRTGSTVALTHFTSGPALALLSDHKIFYMEENDYGTFCKWNTHPLFISDSVFTWRLLAQLKKTGQVVLVSNQKNTMEKILKSNLTKTCMTKEIIHLQDGMIQTENYTVYVIREINSFPFKK